MSLVKKLANQAMGLDLPEETPQEEKQAKKASLVQKLAAEHGGEPVVEADAPRRTKGLAPGYDTPEEDELKEKEEEMEKLRQQASLVRRLSSLFSQRPLAFPIKVGEVRFENMESAQKAVTKIYEQTEKALDDLSTTASDLQGNNLDLASEKVQDMAQSIRQIKEMFESEFPHLMKFTADDESAPEGIVPPEGGFQAPEAPPPAGPEAPPAAGPAGPPPAPPAPGPSGPAAPPPKPPQGMPPGGGR